MKKVLLTSVCRPLGVAHGDPKSVGYELLYCQVTRAQGIFSPRSHHIHFSLEYVAENLEAPTTVLQEPLPIASKASVFAIEPRGRILQESRDPGGHEQSA